MSENLIVAYHLSHSEVPAADSQGLFKALTAEFVFNHWQPGQVYLHQVSYPQGAIVDYREDGHHDGISSFSWDEFVMVDNLTSRQFWQLDNRESLFSLLESEFMTDLGSSIFCSRDTLHRTILTLADIELAVDYIRRAQLDVQELQNCLTEEHTQLLKELLKSGLFSEEDFCRVRLAGINWKKLTTEKDSFSGVTLESQLGLSDTFEALLRNIYLDSPPPKTEKLRAVMVSLSLIKGLPWLHYITAAERVILPCGIVLMLLRQKQSTSIEAIFQHPDIELEYGNAENSCDSLIDRLAVYQHFDLLKSLHNKLGGFDKQQSIRCASSLSATGSSKFQVATFNIVEDQEVLKRQLQSSDSSLEDAAGCGYLLLCKKLLDSETISQAELDSALLSAAEQGYCEIVKLLHKHGGSLEAGGRWPIRYANKFGYQQLKTYLLEQGQEDLRF
ncbi:ankyrin repeat domain-containing protein [Psychromonas aquimarina]|uniref:ankyrin repeat domain-containing protein n=1 Tax=Psychromonas aquimarina TaxID=444919 RepID=UPI0003FC6531|nr:ankyrin repeat domain-containing protein [Psychromonas aquimarina]